MRISARPSRAAAWSLPAGTNIPPVFTLLLNRLRKEINPSLVPWEANSKRGNRAGKRSPICFALSEVGLCVRLQPYGCDGQHYYSIREVPIGNVRE